MGFLRANDLTAEQRTRREKSILERRKVIAVVYGIPCGERVLGIGSQIESRRSEVFSNRLYGVIKVLSDSGSQAVRELLRPIGHRPYLHVREHARVQPGNWNRRIEVRAICSSVPGRRIDHVTGQQALARITVGNEGDVAESQRVPETFVIAEEEHLVFF